MSIGSQYIVSFILGLFTAILLIEPFGLEVWTRQWPFWHTILVGGSIVSCTGVWMQIFNPGRIVKDIPVIIVSAFLTWGYYALKGY